MKKFNWNQEKNEKLKAERGISFEEVIFAINNNGLLDDIKHPSRTNQRLFEVKIVFILKLLFQVEKLTKHI